MSGAALSNVKLDCEISRANYKNNFTIEKVILSAESNVKPDYNFTTQKTREESFQNMLMFEVAGVVIGCIVVVIIVLYLRVKCHEQCVQRRVRDHTDLSNVTRALPIPSYSEATKDDPPNYSHVVNSDMYRRSLYGTEYVVNTSETSPDIH